jgi:Cupin
MTGILDLVEPLDPFPPSDPLGSPHPGDSRCPPMPGYLWFHVVASGRIWVETGEEEQGWIQLGDLALVPHGDGHVLRSEPGAPAPGILDLEREPVSDRYEILRHGEGGAPTA